MFSVKEGAQKKESQKERHAFGFSEVVNMLLNLPLWQCCAIQVRKEILLAEASSAAAE